jgi:glycosyltransferase involved in cell wall biosynthesis
MAAFFTRAAREDRQSEMPTSATISFIVPALNEEAAVKTVLEGIHAKAVAHFHDFEIIAVNDGSTDSTGRIMDAFAAAHAKSRVIHNPRNLGLGRSFQRGLQEARFQYVMLLCGDGGLPPRSLPAIFDKIGSADLILPYMTNLRGIKSRSRYVVSRTYQTLLNLLFGFHIRYYNGLPVYRRSLLKAIRITSGGFGFQGEIVVKLLKSGCTYVEVGVEGAEEKGRSFAFRPRNIISVAKTFILLVLEILRFKPVPPHVVASSRRPETIVDERARS